MVRVAGPARPGRRRAVRSLARRPHPAADARRDPRARARPDGRAVALWRDELCPALAAEGILVGTRRGRDRGRAQRARAGVPAPDLPRADAARRRPGPAVPLHLGPLAQPRAARARPRGGRGALRAGEGARRASTASSRSARAACCVPLESVIVALPAAPLPGDGGRRARAFRLTRDGDTEISDDADDLLEAVESELRNRRFGAVVRIEVSSSISRDDARRG